MIIQLEPNMSRIMRETPPTALNPIHWQQSLGLARQICARVFRDGGTPGQALVAAGLAFRADVGWDKAVEQIAETMSRATGRRAA